MRLPARLVSVAFVALANVNIGTSVRWGTTFGLETIYSVVYLVREENSDNILSVVLQK